MNKYFILAVVAVGFACCESWAFIEQSASSALSLNNVVGSSTAPAPQYVDKVEEKTVAEAKTVDIRNSVAKNVSLQKAQELVIVLPEKEGMSWKVNYDSGRLSMVNNSKDGNYRKVKFIQNSSQSSTIYFDGIGSDGSVVQNKAVYVKVD